MGNQNGHCAVCNSKIIEILEKTVNCSICGAPHCVSCWGYNGDKCAIYGCGSGDPRKFVEPKPIERQAVPQTSSVVSRSTLAMDALDCFRYVFGLMVLAVGLTVYWDVETVKVGEVVLYSDGYSMQVLDKPGTRYFRSVTGATYVYPNQKLNQFDFNYHNDWNGGLINDNRIEVRFSDMATAKIAGSFSYEDELVASQHNGWNSHEYVVEHIIKPKVEMALAQTAALMSSFEAYTHRRNEFSTRAKREISDYLEPWGIKISNLEISEIKLPPNIERDIQQKIEAQKAANKTKAILVTCCDERTEQRRAIHEDFLKNVQNRDIVPAVHIK